MRHFPELSSPLECCSALYSVFMSAKKKFLLIVLLLAIPASLLWVRHLKRRTVTVVGAVITRSSDPAKELPIAGVRVSTQEGRLAAESVSDSSGLYKLTMRRLLLFGSRGITVHFRHPEYQPLNLYIPVTGALTVAKLVPVSRANRSEDNGSKQIVASPVVRYSIKRATEENVGSAARSFVVSNQGNVPCNGASLCSPDKKWKAAIGSISLDAGTGHEFRNARASCIAGPCPFTRIDTSNLGHPGQVIHVSAVTWSDTATFLVEAEVVHPMVSDVVRYSYPFISDNALNFTLPHPAEGLSIQAELNSQNIIFPVGPTLMLSWADCNARSNPDQTRVYRCELKSGYRLQNSGT
jgi:hypothetical protein